MNQEQWTKNNEPSNTDGETSHPGMTNVVSLTTLLMYSRLARLNSEIVHGLLKRDYKQEWRLHFTYRIA